MRGDRTCFDDGTWKPRRFRHRRHIPSVAGISHLAKIGHPVPEAQRCWDFRRRPVGRSTDGAERSTWRRPNGIVRSAPGGCRRAKRTGTDCTMHAGYGFDPRHMHEVAVLEFDGSFEKSVRAGSDAAVCPARRCGHHRGRWPVWRYRIGSKSLRRARGAWPSAGFPDAVF